VAGLPAVDARVVAKAWLVELVAGSSLEDAGALPAAEIAREGPGLAAAVLAALGDDAALRRLTSGGNLDWLSSRAGQLAGAAGPAGAVRAGEALRRATQACVLDAGRLDAVTTAELVDRLAHVCALVAEASAAQAGAAAVAAGAAAPAGAAMPAGEPERGEHRPEREAPPPPPGDAGSWEAAVARRLERHAQDGIPFALLAIEVDGVQRLRGAQQEGEVDALLEAVERALTSGLRPADQLLRAEEGRYWVTAPDTGPAVARVLAELLAETARSAAEHGGAPLTVSVGVATCPEDGGEVAALAAAADQAMFAARATGAPVS
jgi:GGDEF domain-containing protein